MNTRGRNWSFLLSLGLGALPLGCYPDGQQLIATKAPPPDPCVESDANLSDGIQDGDELRAVFDCVNRGGQFDAFVPLMDAMQTSQVSDGRTTVLDMWANILNEEISSAKGSGVSVNTSDLVGALDDLIAVLSEPWVPSVVDLAGSALSNGVVEPLVPVLGSIAAPIVDLQSANKYDNFLATLTNVLCPGLEADTQCTGNVQQVYRGLMEVSAAYGTEDYPMPSGEELTALLVDVLAPAGGNVSTNRALDQALGRGVARLGHGQFLVNTLSRDFPLLYGDDPETPTIEGYESRDARRSALYGILSMLSDPSIDPETQKTYLEEMEAELNEVGPLISNYYVWSVPNRNGQTGTAPAGSCDGGSSGNFAKDNPAYFGLDQILRLMKSIDVDYTDNPLCATALDAALAGLPAIYGTKYYELELSGTTNVATLLLEIFSQLPVELVQEATDSGSYSASVLAGVNSLCGTHIQADDYEALQASVHIEEVIEPTLELLAAVNHAGQMETLKNVVVGLYDTHALCEMRPWLVEMTPKNGPLASAVGQVVPYLPGQPWHDKVMLPLLKTVNGLQGQPAKTIIPPIAQGLTGTGNDLGDVLTGLGQVALSAQEEASAGGDPALYQYNQIMADLAAYDPNYTGIESIARLIQEKTLLTGALETVAVPEVQDAFDTAPPDGETPVQYLSGVVNSGDLLNLLELLRSLLIQVDNEIKNPSAGQTSGN